MPAIDEAKFQAFIGKMLGDLGGATSVPTVRIGLRLGLFEALAEAPATAAELAARAGGLHERYVREWALAQTASGYIDFDPATQRFSVSPEQAMVFVNQDSPVYLAGAFELVAAMIEAEAKVEECFRHGTGVRWGDHAGCLFCATGQFFRPGYVNNIVQAWIPALDGVEARLRGGGAKVADVGCGVGFSTLLMAQAYPESQFTGYDFHAPSIEEARRHAAAHGLSDRVRFEVAAAKEIAESGFDLVTMYDCLHDMGDPRGCAAHMRGILAPGGTWMIVEPIAGDRPEQNFNPVGRLYYNASTMICVPTSLDQEVGEGLGAQAGEARLSEIVREAGFDRVRRATEGPFNMVLEAV
ncbi:class I SAM-dependent methyltransferase [Sphingomonas sp. MS122]|uniref:class I SAM-dependent methyltransferase n=1 Tax=Sphingomonas sp. MS122 TaxID=3412683 RepID=UPI003C30A61D